MHNEKYGIVLPWSLEQEIDERLLRNRLKIDEEKTVSAFVVKYIDPQLH